MQLMMRKKEEHKASDLAFLGSLFVLVMILLMPAIVLQGFVHAAEGEFVISKDVTGSVGLVRHNYITIVYEADEKKRAEFEIGFYLDSSVKLVRKRAFTELEIGDMVKVTYDELQREYEKMLDDGTIQKDIKVVSRKARAVTFMKPAKGLSS